MWAAIRLIWSACFLGGAFNHARDIWVGGWLPYEFMPLPFNVFWTMLLPLDLLAAALIWISPRYGSMLGVAIMVTDVLVNSWTVFGAGFHEMTTGLALQTIFCAFVLVTAKIVARSGSAMKVAI